jgi:thiamine-monophosphate kinase
MIDLSDGLAGDLRHVLKASHVGAELLKPAIPISRAAKERSRVRESAEGVAASRESADARANPPTHVGGYKTPLLAALTDGEDFELLFTLASKNAVPLLDAWKKQFPKVRLSCIGKIVAGNSVTLRDKDGRRPFPLHGYDHFA